MRVDISELGGGAQAASRFFLFIGCFFFMVGLLLFSFHTADNQSRLYLSIYSVFHPGFHLSGI